ncbi:hypothetical protein WL40_12570 [Burkholderia ubonensis]|nr:hypothetical protein WL40_12570 [Burkholderia ubonensis]
MRAFVEPICIETNGLSTDVRVIHIEIDRIDTGQHGVAMRKPAHINCLPDQKVRIELYGGIEGGRC